MTRLSWGNAGERTYETGVDRGVLYLETAVPWNGLVSVNENPSGGNPQPYYFDGVKYMNIAEAEEFEATIDAFSSPPEFSRCDGTRAVANGLFLTQQPRKSFGLAYRTLIGNDVQGLNHGYKIHLVYNALAGPANRDHSSLSDDVDPLILSWGITTRAPVVSGHKPTAHLIVDSTKTHPVLLSEIEEILYGSENVQPRLIPVSEIVSRFVEFPLTINAFPDGSYSASGRDVAIATPASFTIDHEQVVNNGDGSFIINY